MDSSSVSLTSSHVCSHLTRLLLAVGHTPSSSSYIGGVAGGVSQRELGVILLDAVAPQSTGELKQWPEDETLKYSLERYSLPPSLPPSPNYLQFTTGTLP